jgi:glycosyltransferase involved in cell wall biosynthesis
MNILFIEQHPRFIGGSERISLSLCSDLRKRGHSTHLLYEAEGDMVAAYKDATVAVHRAAVRPLAVRRPWEAATSLAKLGSLLRRQDIDVIFTSQLGYVSLLALARVLFRVPTVVHLGLGLRFDSPLYGWSISKMASGVAPSEHMRQTWLGLGWPAARIHVVPNGVDLTRFKPLDNATEVRAGIGLPGSDPVVAYVGRLVEEKGVFTLMRAAALLKERGDAFHLVLVGSSPEGQREALEGAARNLGLGRENVSIHPPTSRPEAYYAVAEVVVVPSEWPEPFGLAAIEAMASGAVPVVSDAGILPEIIGREQSACVFPQGDAGQLAGRLHLILANAEARKSIRAACLSRVREHFDLVRCGEAYERELQRCVKDR